MIIKPKCYNYNKMLFTTLHRMLHKQKWSYDDDTITVCYTSAFSEVIYADFSAKILDWNFRLVDENSRILVVIFASKLNFSFSFRFVDENYRIVVVVVVFVMKINLLSSTKIFVFVVVDEKKLLPTRYTNTIYTGWQCAITIDRDRRRWAYCLYCENIKRAVLLMMLKPRLHDKTCCQIGLPVVSCIQDTAGCQTGCFIQPDWQPVVSCKRGIRWPLSNNVWFVFNGNRGIQDAINTPRKYTLFQKSKPNSWR